MISEPRFMMVSNAPPAAVWARAPSAVAAIGEIPTPSGSKPFPVPRALETLEVPVLVEQFRCAIVNSCQAGFDGVEIHAANGFLVDQFLRDGANRRTDRYGGSIENRTRFLLDIVDHAIDVFGAEGVGVRISPHAIADGLTDSDPHALYEHVALALDHRRAPRRGPPGRNGGHALVILRGGRGGAQQIGDQQDGGNKQPP